MSRFAFFTVLLMGVFAQPESSGSAYFSADNLRPLVGEPIELWLVAPLESGSLVTSWPDFPVQWGNFEIESVGELTTTESTAGLVEYRQRLTARLWEPGDYETPSVAIGYQLSGGTTPVEIVVQPAFFTVPSVLTSGDVALAAPKAPVYMAYFPVWLFPLLVFTGIASTTLAITYGRQRSHRRRQVRVEAGDSRLMGQGTLAFLHNIDPNTTDPADVYDLADHALRVHLRDHYRVPAGEMTTGELLYAMQNCLPESLLGRLQQLLSQADLVKFARVYPDRASAQRYLQATVRWVEAAMRDANDREGEEGVPA